METGRVGAHVVHLLAHAALEAGGAPAAELSAVQGGGTFAAVATGAAQARVGRRRRLGLVAASSPEAGAAGAGETGAGVGAGPARPAGSARAVVDFQAGARPGT